MRRDHANRAHAREEIHLSPRIQRTMTINRTRIRAAAVALGALGALSFPLTSSAVPASPVITTPADGGVVTGLSPVTIRGTAPAGSSVEVLEAVDGSLGTASANADGAWSLSKSLTDGSYTLTATASDAGGTSSPPSTPITFEVDAVRPTVSISSPEDGHAFGAGEPLLIEGSASDERTIHAIRLEYWRLGTMVAEKLADCPDCGSAPASDWSARPTLEPGYYNLRAYSFDAAGNRSASAATVSFVVSGLQGGETPDLGLVDLEDLPEIPTVLEPEEGDVVPGADEPTTISGETEPGSTVEVYEEVAGFGPIGTAVDEDEDGTWSVEVILPTGSYGVRTQATDPDGNVSPLGDLILFEVDAELPSLANLTGDGAMFLPTQEIVIEGEALDDRAAYAVVLEYWLGDERVAHELADCPACGEQDAAWSHRPEGLEPGYYHVKVRAIDGAGQRSTVQVVTFTKLGL